MKTNSGNDVLKHMSDKKAEMDQLKTGNQQY